MTTKAWFVVVSLECALIFHLAQSAHAATWYVATNGSDTAAGTNWASARRTIQAAIDLAADNDTVLVTNGVYASGGRVTHGALTNRIAITNAIAVRSVNGPAVTIIQGNGPDGDAAVRCAYIGGSAVLAGFTLTNGHTQANGTNYYTEESGGGVWCVSNANAVVSNCVLCGNSAWTAGGGSYDATLINCTLSGNGAGYWGGGSYQGTLDSCTLSGNEAWWGGGSYASALNSCTLFGNSAYAGGGGSLGGTLNNCTITSNESFFSAGGSAGGTLNNCIVYFNVGIGGDQDGATLSYCCAPRDPGGVGNITNAPLFVNASLGNFRLKANSPGIDAGNNALVQGSTDRDGKARVMNGTVDMGAYELSGPVTWCVATNGSDSADGWSWATAKQTIQAAIDPASAGDTVLVSNGVYATGGRAVSPAVLTNRIAIDLPITVRSVNGPAVTIIVGAADPVSTNGLAAIRCAYVGDGARLSGFTLTNGHTRLTGDPWATMQCGGGVWCGVGAVVSNCILSGNSAAYAGGGAIWGTLNNCTLSGNSAKDGGGEWNSTLNNCILSGNWAGSGGGSYGYQVTHVLNNCTLSGNHAVSDGGGSGWGILNNCTLSSNSAAFGGGAHSATLKNCTLFANSAANSGGGAAGGNLDHCTLTGNSSQEGGGADGGTLSNCTLSANSASQRGGGARSSTLINCALTGNSADLDGGGAHNATLNNCTLSGNSASRDGGGSSGGEGNNCTLSGNAAARGGGAYLGTLNNCIVYSNAAPSGTNYSGGTLMYCCTTPLPAGNGNITNDPRFVNAAADNLRLMAGSPCINAGSNAYVQAATDLDGRPRILDGTVDMGAYEYDAGYRFVAIASTNPVAPYGTWATAATNIQDAIDVCVSNCTVLVSNGVYATGGRVVQGALTNRIAIGDAITVRSVNGPAVTIIAGAADPLSTNGDAAIRCAYLGANARLSGFTLTNGHTRADGDFFGERSGGGVWCADGAVVSNCLLSANSAAYAGGGSYFGTLNHCTLSNNTAYGGGGSYNGVLNDCTLSGNAASLDAGGALRGTLSRCTLSGNSAEEIGGGAIDCTLNNCTLSGNTATWGGGSSDGTLNDCTLSGNTATWGGGSSDGTLNRCTLSDNSARMFGGGSYGSTLNDCTLSHNSADQGGGSYHDKLRNCILSGNTASYGGGSYESELNNCTLFGNSTDVGDGGGAYGGTLNNCTITGNRSRSGGGGSQYSTLNNCIVYFNDGFLGSNDGSTALVHCCTMQDPGGIGNITNAPQFVDATASNFHLRADSPCIDAGSNALAQGSTDLDGNARIVNGRVDMGAYEFQSAPGGYWAWAAAITNGLTNYTDCALGDGRPNLLRYATGSSPTNADRLAVLNGLTTGGLFAVRFNRNTNATDVTLIAERASSLTISDPWKGIATNVHGTWGGAASVIEAGTTNPVAVIVKDTATATSNAFFRLRITRP